MRLQANIVLKTSRCPALAVRRCRKCARQQRPAAPLADTTLRHNRPQANELSRQLTEVRLKHFKVNLDKGSHDPDLSRLNAALKASKRGHKTGKRAFSESQLKKLAGLE